MTKYEIPVYSNQTLTPRAMEVIRAIVDDSYPEHEINFKKISTDDTKVLVFGNLVGFNYGSNGTEFIHTYSIAQLMTKANAATALKAAIRHFIVEPEIIPFLRPIEVSAVDAVVRLLDPTKPTAIDIETNGNLGKTHTPEEVELISVAFYQPGKAPLVIARHDNEIAFTQAQRDSLAKILPQFEFGIYHNGKFDIRVLEKQLGIKLINSFDTMLAHHVLNQAAGDHKLKSLARNYLGAPEWEADLRKYTKNGGHYELIPVDLLVEYNGWDVYWTYKLFEFLYPQIVSDENYQKAFSLEMASADMLLKVEQYGIPFDIDYAEGYASTLLARQNNCALNLGGLNPNSPKQVRDYFTIAGYPPISSTNEETLTELRPLVDKTAQLVIDNILDYRKAGKIRGTYAEGWAGKSRSGRVHPTFLVHGTTTGRLSSTQPNAQNMPRSAEIRRLVKTHG